MADSEVEGLEFVVDHEDLKIQTMSMNCRVEALEKNIRPKRCPIIYGILAFKHF